MCAGPSVSTRQLQHEEASSRLPSNNRSNAAPHSDAAEQTDSKAGAVEMHSTVSSLGGSRGRLTAVNAYRQAREAAMRAAGMRPLLADAAGLYQKHCI